MFRCFFCNKKKITVACKWCKHDFCTTCIQVESHECPEIESCVSSKKLELCLLIHNKPTIEKIPKI